MVNVSNGDGMMQPYRESAKKNVERAKAPYQAMEKASTLLSYYIPTNLAIQGLSKINPQLNNFFKLAQKYGFSGEESVDLVRDKQQEFNAKEKKGSLFDEIIGDVEVETLDQNKQSQLAFLRSISDQLESKGIGLDNPAFKKIKDKVKAILSGKMEGIMGEAMAQGPMQSQEMQPQMQQPNPMQEPPMQAQPGQGQQALMAILQKIQAQRGQGG